MNLRSIGLWGISLYKACESQRNTVFKVKISRKNVLNIYVNSLLKLGTCLIKNLLPKLGNITIKIFLKLNRKRKYKPK